MGADFSFGLDGKQKSRNIDVDYILDLEMRERKSAQIMAISENISISFSFHPLGNLFRPFSFHQKKKKTKFFLMTVTFSFSSLCTTPPQWLPPAFYCFCPFPDFPPPHPRSYILGSDFLDPIISISLPPTPLFRFLFCPSGCRSNRSR